MFKNLKLTAKLWSLTALLLLAVLIVAGSSIRSIKGMLSASIRYADASINNLFVHEKEIDHLTWVGKLQGLFNRNSETLDVELDHTKCGLGKFLYGEEGETLSKGDPKLAALLNDIKEPHQHLHESGKLIKDIWRQRHKGLRHLLKDRLDDHRRWAAEVSRMVIEQNDGIQVELDSNLCTFGKFLGSEQYTSYAENFPALREAVEAVKEPHRQLHESAKEIKAFLQAGKYGQAANIYKIITLPGLEKVQNHFNQAIMAEGAIEDAQSEAYRIYETETIPAVTATQSGMKALSEQLEEIQSTLNAGMAFTGRTSRTSATAVTVAAFIIGGLLSFFAIRSIIRPIRSIIQGLDEGAQQVASASGQVSASSRQLAEGSSEQAGALEETSSALEEMSSMTKQNATNAGQAVSLNKEANLLIGKANQSMADLNTSMQDIIKASEETSKIVKTIDEIAFQTNLLALNAAVEAARAGEAGAGFAVVSDEVRNLAMRAADAAKNTSTLIEGTVKKIKGGADLVDKTDEAFSRVAQSVHKVGQLVGEIAGASNEQAEGIEQVNKAVVEMDRVVQRNAANSEENASASEVMSSMAVQMNFFVSELVRLIEGSKGNVDANQAAGDYQPMNENQALLAPLVKVRKTNAAEIHAERSKIGLSKEVRPGQVTPMEEDFENF